MPDPIDSLKLGTRWELGLIAPSRGTRCIVCRQDHRDLECELCGSGFHDACYWQAIATTPEKALQDDEPHRYPFLCHACRS